MSGCNTDEAAFAPVLMPAYRRIASSRHPLEQSLENRFKQTPFKHAAFRLARSGKLLPRSLMQNELDQAVPGATHPKERRTALPQAAYSASRRSPDMAGVQDRAMPQLRFSSSMLFQYPVARPAA